MFIVSGGKGANQAVAAARAGAKVTIISRIGKDGIGQNVLSNLMFGRTNVLVLSTEKPWDNYLECF